MVDDQTTLKLTSEVLYRYAKAEVCYVYLFDVVASGDGELCDLGGTIVDIEARKAFGASEWWSRGWTLQELVAPSNVIFFDKDWVRLGTKASLQIVSQIYLLRIVELRNHSPVILVFPLVKTQSGILYSNCTTRRLHLSAVSIQACFYLSLDLKTSALPSECHGLQKG